MHRFAGPGAEVGAPENLVSATGDTGPRDGEGTALRDGHFDKTLSLNLATTGGTSQYTTGYAYDDAGRLLNVWHHPVLDTMTKAPTGNPTFTYGYTYTQANPGDLRVGAGGGAGQEDFMPFTVTRGGNPALTANRTYEGTRDALHKIENKAGGTVVSSYTYTVNPISQRTSVATAGTAFAGTAADWTWGYDALGQLTTADHANTNASDRAYQYDSIGNREKTAAGTLTLPGNVNWVSNPLNQYTTADGVALPTTPAPAPFDLDGNLTAGPVPGTNGNLPGVQAPANATEIKWDAENRFVSLKIGATTYGYAYDHLSRMSTRTTNGAVTNRYHYDGWNRIAQHSGSTLQTRYTWGLDLSGTMQGAGGVGGMLGTRLSNGIDYFPTYDGNGNVSAYLANSGAAIVHFEYDPFGRLTRTTGTLQSQSHFEYRFSTKPRDAATGLYYYGYRWYDPYTGRWINRDPIEESGGVNLYANFTNTPIHKSDFLGLLLQEPPPRPPGPIVIGSPPIPKTLPPYKPSPFPRVTPDALSLLNLLTTTAGPYVQDDILIREMQERAEWERDGEELALWSPPRTQTVEEEVNGKCCRYGVGGRLGGGLDSPVARYANSLQYGIAQELTVQVIQKGVIIGAARYDASRPIPILVTPLGPDVAYEAKFGWEWLSGPKESFRHWWEGRQNRKAETHEQFRNQQMVAEICRFEYVIAVSTLEGADGFAEQFPDFAGYINHIPWWHGGL